ncbi:MAG: zinc-dependent alcohol dehydrogenase [Acidimicrobiia bacterium]
MCSTVPIVFALKTGRCPSRGPGQVRVRLARAGICGSDLHGYTGESGRRAPGMVMGHEASGWIETTGPGVEMPLGTLVTFNPAIPCSCGHHATNRCLELRVVGATPELPGAFADALVIPADRVVPVGELSPEWAAGVEPMAVALQAADQAGVRPGDRVLVVGGGMIGQCAAQAAFVRGAGEVVVSDPVPHRRAVAEACGFRGVEPDALPGLGTFDRAIDCVGISASAAPAIRAVPKGGVVCLVGLGLPEVTLPLFDVVVAERTLVGSFCYTGEVFVEAARLLGGGRLDLAPLIGDVIELAEVPGAFEDLARGTRHETKVMVTTGADGPELA